ncbi:hypothetical protein H0E87_000834 [Populus deltoides]|uniref:Proteasome assembly chaperone 3 n=2 Tax=Populus TaxID=3689 RepID=A0A8X8BZC4_POPTO|nr:hypothetical protein POTOM_059798 [Populus tomentosa]KAH8519173.1 hypothetical protein H0E87_000834 [Populus deltoides]
MVVFSRFSMIYSAFVARKDESLSIHPTFNVSVIFGKRDEPMLVACARQLIEHISTSGSSKPLVLSLGLQDHSSETLRGVVSAVTANRVW